MFFLLELISFNSSETVLGIDSHIDGDEEMSGTENFSTTIFFQYLFNSPLKIVAEIKNKYLII